MKRNWPVFEVLAPGVYEVDLSDNSAGAYTATAVEGTYPKSRADGLRALSSALYSLHVASGLARRRIAPFRHHT